MDPHPTLPQDLWDQTPPAVRAYLETLEGQVQPLTSMIDTLPEQVRALQEQVTQTSRNASRPPSRDPPQSPRPSRPRGQRRRGGPPGHRGQTRPLVPVDEVDEGGVLKPDQWSGCQAPLSGDEASPFRQQVMELPPLTPVSTAYQWPQLVGPACGATTRAPWPDGVPRRPDGPRGQAPVALCPGAYRLSQRTTQQGREEIGGIPMRVATVSQGEQAMTAVVVAPVEEARPEVHEHAGAHLDETSWRHGDKRGGLWVAVTRWVTVCVVRLSRGGDRARALLGETFAGMWGTDRSRAYNWYPVRWRQRCWAHGLRDGAAMQRRGGASEALGVAWLAHAHPMCAWWQRVREGT